MGAVHKRTNRMKVIVVHNRHGVNGAAWVSDEDYERLNAVKWYMLKVPGSRTRYARGTLNGQTTYMHQAVLGKKDGLEIDHIDGDGLNNQRENLEHVTHGENLRRAHAHKAFQKPKNMGDMRWTVRELADGTKKAYFYCRTTGKRITEEEAETRFPDGFPQSAIPGLQNGTKTVNGK